MTARLAEAALAVSGSFAVSLTVKITVTMALALVGVRLAHRSRAALRHIVLAAAFAVLLMLPIVSIVAPSVRLVVPVVHTLAESPGVVAFTNAPTAGESIAAVPVGWKTIGSSTAVAWSLVAAGWVAGAAILLLPVMVGLWQMRACRRGGRRWRHGRSVVQRLALAAGIHRHVEVLMHESMPGPATFGFIRPTIVLPEDARTWHDADLQRAIVHELEHVRRGDWLTQNLARVICAVYWFHPLVWIAWRQLALEAERACDDAVLRRAEATAYANQLVALAQRLSSAAHRPLPAMASCDALATRVAAVLDRGQARGRASASSVVITGAAAMLVLTMLSPIRVVAAAQVSSGPVTDRPIFEVASVRPSSHDDGISGGDCRGAGGGGTENSGGALAAMARAAGIAPASPGRCRFARVTLKDLIAYAYAISPRDAERLIVGGPRWIDGDRFDVETKSETLVPVAEMQLMLQQLLAARFKLRVHREAKELDGYALVVAAGGAKLQQATGSEPRAGMTTIGGGPVTAWKTTMPMLATYLSLRLGRPVDDQTALPDRYNFTLSWTPADDERPRFDSRNLPPEIREKLQRNSDQSGTSVFTALQEQLGLRLVARRVMGEIFVVDAAELPSEN